jgi:hypothetical protein
MLHALSHGYRYAVDSILHIYKNTAMTDDYDDDNDYDDNDNGYRHRYRQLTFIYVDDEWGDVTVEQDNNQVIGFSILSAAFLLTFLYSIRLSRNCREFYEWNALRLLLPAVSLALIIECVTLAYQYSGRLVSSPWAIVVYMLQATVAPNIFLATFVTTYLAHRTRSIPFCLVYRGHPTQQESPEMAAAADDPYTQALVRPPTLIIMIRLLALGLLVLSLIVNFDVVWEDSVLAGRTGWATVVSEPWESESAHIVLSLIPMAITSWMCLYFALLLWRYGTLFSMVIYPSLINPWLSLVMGTLLLMGGQWLGPDLFPILSNTGIFMYTLSLIRLLLEVRTDMLQATDLGNFLNALGDDEVAGSGVPERTDAVNPNEDVMMEKQSTCSSRDVMEAHDDDHDDDDDDHKVLPFDTIIPSLPSFQ